MSAGATLQAALATTLGTVAELTGVFDGPPARAALLEKTVGTTATYGAEGWQIGTVRASRILIEGQQVVGPQAAAIADPTGGATVDSEARSIIAEMLSALRQHGLISQ